MNNIPKIQAVFYISGKDFEPDEITKMINIKPSSCRSMRNAPVKEYAKSFWALKTEKEDSKTISCILQQLIDMLKEKEDLILSVIEKYNCKIRFTINIWIEDGERLEMLLTRENLEFVNEIGADIAFDLFFD